MSLFLEIRGLVVHVALSGPRGAPAVLLIHSLGASLEIWEAQARALAAGLFVIRYDLRGHGLSAAARDDDDDAPVTLEDLAADALALLDALEVEAAHVGGISIGGMIAQQLAADAPERVHSLILCDTAMQLPPPEMWRERAALVRREGLAPLVDATLERWVSPAYAATAAGRGLRGLFLRTTPEGYAAAAEALAAADLTTSTPGLLHPALVLVGERDPSTPPAMARALAEALPESRLVIIPGGRHVPLGEHADAVTAAILEHLTPRGAAAAGATVRSEVLGKEHVARAAAATTALDRDFQAYLTRAAWGEVWARPHLDRRTRSLLTIAVLAALGHHEELELHLRAIQRTGATAADLTEVLLHVAVYAGVPAANAAMRLAKRVLEERKP